MADQLKEELKEHLIRQLNLEDTTPADIGDDAPLFHPDGLGLDSIDVLELVVMFEQQYGVTVINPEDSREAFYSISSMAEYIRQQTGEVPGHQ